MFPSSKEVDGVGIVLGCFSLSSPILSWCDGTHSKMRLYILTKNKFSIHLDLSPCKEIWVIPREKLFIISSIQN